MLIVDCENPDFGAACDILSDWSGPRCLLRRKGVALPASADDDALVFEFISEPSSVLVALRSLFLRLERHVARPGHALIFLGLQATPDICARLAADNPPPPWKIAWTLAAETGELETLVLGEEVVRNPLFYTYFRNMDPALTAIYTGPSLELMTTHLVWHNDA